MNEQIFPLLEEMRILRTDALKGIRDRAFDALPLYLNDYSDGIVSGCDFIADKDMVKVLPGIVKHDEFFYFLKKPMSINYTATEEYALLKLKFEDKKTDESILLKNVQLMLTPDTELKKDEIELCRFKLKSGAVLRTKYVDFFDYMTEFDTVNLIFAPAASSVKSSLLPKITEAWGKEAMNYDLNPLDQCFCLKTLSKTTLSYDEIAFYIAHRLEIPFDDWDNLALYKKLCQILTEIKANGERRCRNISRGRREVLVD